MRNEEIDKLRFQGYGYKKIARLLRLSENTIKSYCRRHPFDKTQKVCLQWKTPHISERKNSARMNVDLIGGILTRS